MKELFVDELTLSSVLWLMRSGGPARVTVLEPITGRQRPWISLLRARGMTVGEASFFLGHLHTADGESAYLAGRRISGALALQGAEEAVRADPELHRLNESYGRNTILLHVAKHLRPQIDHAARRILVARTLASGRRCRLLMKRPTGFDGQLLVRAFPDVEVQFHGTSSPASLSAASMFLLRVLARDVKLTFGAGPAARLETERSRTPSVLMLQEDTIRGDRSLRGQPHWLDVAGPPRSFETFVITTEGFSVADDESLRALEGVCVHTPSVYRAAVQASRDHSVLRGVRRDRQKALLAFLRRPAGANRVALVYVIALLRQAELIGAVAVSLNVRVFLIRETYYHMADAMLLVAPALGVTTIAYQYANLGGASLNLLTTADTLLVFSDMYRAVFQENGITARKFVTAGYLYDGVDRLVRDRAKMHRETLTKAGAEFVVCYFDESVQHDRWGLVSRDDHLGELHALAAAVLQDPKFGVVVKSQFMFNSPSQTYPGDDMIRRAKASGRYLELMYGNRRNDIYPTEAALAADLCIGHKFGATAALEAAVAGVPAVLLDCYNTRTLWDHLYARADIQYETIEALMQAISDYREGKANARRLGDWGEIIHHFDPHRDGKAVDRLRNVVENSVSTSASLPG